MPVVCLNQSRNLRRAHLVNQFLNLSLPTRYFHPASIYCSQIPIPSPSSSSRLIEENKGHAAHNIPPSIAAKLGRQLHLQRGHPLSLIRTRLEQYFTSRQPGMTYFNDLEPAMGTMQAFDELLFASDHPGRNATDTYYITDRTLLHSLPPFIL